MDLHDSAKDPMQPKQREQVLGTNFAGFPFAFYQDRDEDGELPWQVELERDGAQRIYMREADTRADWWTAATYREVDPNVMAGQRAAACEWDPIGCERAGQFSPYHGDAMWTLTHGGERIHVCGPCRALQRFHLYSATPVTIMKGSPARITKG